MGADDGVALGIGVGAVVGAGVAEAWATAPWDAPGEASDSHGELQSAARHHERQRRARRHDQDQDRADHGRAHGAPGADRGRGRFGDDHGAAQVARAVDMPGGQAHELLLPQRLGHRLAQRGATVRRIRASRSAPRSARRHRRPRAGTDRSPGRRSDHRASGASPDPPGLGRGRARTCRSVARRGDVGPVAGDRVVRTVDERGQRGFVADSRFGVWLDRRRGVGRIDRWGAWSGFLLGTGGVDVDAKLARSRVVGHTLSH